MKKEYIKPEVDLIDLIIKERLMTAEDEAILFGGNNALLDDFKQELSPNFDNWQ